MSYAITADTMDLQRTADLPSNTNFSLCCWYKHFTGLDFETNFHLRGDGGSGGLYMQFNAETALSIGDGLAELPFERTPKPFLWFFWAVTCSATAYKGYWAYPGSRRFHTLSIATPDATTLTVLLLGNSDIGNEHCNGRLAHVKAWKAILSEAELRREMLSQVPKRPGNLYLWTPLRFSAHDMSGQNRDWTVTGAPVAHADEPPIPWDAEAGAGRRAYGLAEALPTEPSGSVLLDFGAWPGSSQASRTVTNQAGILSTSKVDAWIHPSISTEHSVDEHFAEPIRVRAGNIVAGTGFTIHGELLLGRKTTGKYRVAYAWRTP